MKRTYGIRSRWLTAALAGALALALVPTTVFAGTLDQHQDDTSTGEQWMCGASNSYPGCPLSEAQVFSAGISGLLDRVDIHVIHENGTDPLTVQIRNVDSFGAPGTTILASGTIADAANADWYSVSFSSLTTVHAGTPYAIVAYTGSTSKWGWSFVYDGTNNPYPDGDRYNSTSSPPAAGSWSQTSNADNAFRTYVSPSADLSLSMVGPATVNARSTFTYILAAHNGGDATAADVMLTDNLPFGVQYVTSTASQGSCNAPTKKVRTVTCDLGSIAANGDVTVAITVKVVARAGSFINNIANLSGSTFDPHAANNTASLSTAITR